MTPKCFATCSHWINGQNVTHFCLRTDEQGDAAQGRDSSVDATRVVNKPKTEVKHMFMMENETFKAHEEAKAQAFGRQGQ